MADWPVWAWAIIAVVALIIIIAIIVGSRKAQPADSTLREAADPRPFASDADTQFGARRGIPDEDVVEAFDDAPSRPLGETGAPHEVASDPGPPFTPPLGDPAPPASETHTASDPLTEDTIEEPLGGLGAATGAATPPMPMSEDYAADEPVFAEEPVAAADEIPDDDVPATPGRPTIDPDEPDEATPGRPAPTEEGPGAPTPGPSTSPTEDDTEVATPGPPAGVDTPVDTTELGEDPGPISSASDDVPHDEQGRRLDPYGNPVDTVDDGPQYADRGDLGAGDGEDDVPRDDMGRRLDPYGNPVNDSDLPPVPGVPPFRP